MALPTAQYLLALSLELIGKAYFLKAKHGPPESVYTHKVSRLIAPCQLNDDQMKLLVAAEELVIWAGRYPTPKWTKESLKEKYDVPSTFTEGIEHIDASALPNAATAQRCHEFVALFETIRTSWATA